MIHTAVEAPGEAPSMATMEPSDDETSSVPNSRMPPCFGSLLIICTRCPVSSATREPRRSDTFPERSYLCQRPSAAVNSPDRLIRRDLDRIRASEISLKIQRKVRKAKTLVLERDEYRGGVSTSEETPRQLFRRPSHCDERKVLPDRNGARFRSPETRRSPAVPGSRRSAIGEALHPRRR